MGLSASWRVWLQRGLALGPARLALGLGVLLVLVSLALPAWSLADSRGADREISSFSWDRVTIDFYRGSAWDGTTILPYTSTLFSAREVAAALGTAYLLSVAFLIVLAAVLGVLSMAFSRTMPTLSLLILSLIVLGVALLALFYPIATVPAAATTDVGTFTVGGFWGSFRTTGPTIDWAWGPGLGWWFLLAGVVSGVAGAIFPYVKSVRAMVPAVPKPWRPSS